MSWAKLYLGDALKVMKTLKADSIDMCICSPPYWGLRDYGIEKQIGLESTSEEYIQRLVTYFREVKELLKSTGSLYLNLGDTYVNKNLQMMPARVALDLQKDGWILRNDVIWYKPNHMPASVKDRLTNTYEHLFHFVKSRKYYYNLDCIRIPHKTAVKSGSNQDKATTNKMAFNFEEQYGGKQDSVRYSTKFGKNSQIYSLLQNTAYARKVLGKAHDTAMNHPLGKNPGDMLALGRAIKLNQERGKLRSNGSVACHYLDLPDVAKHYAQGGKNPGDVINSNISMKYKGQMLLRNDQRIGGNVGLAEYRDKCRVIGMVEGHPLGQNPGDFWEVKPKPFRGAHFAVYPEALCVRPILSSCPPNGIVLDPFSGSGTTMKVAFEVGRNAIGIELNERYAEIANVRVQEVEIIRIN